MSRIVSYIGGALVVFATIFLLMLASAPTPPLPAATSQAEATSTDATLSESATPAPQASTFDQETVSPTGGVKTAPAQAITATSLVAPTTAPAEPVSSASLDSAAAELRGALVNIICYVPAGSGLHSISGSGVFIDSKGIILTNAHIAQYYLLADRGVSCVVRSGEPAVNKYRAEPIYISPLWVRNNAKAITEQAPIGTGEYDFALLAVTKSATSAPLPSSFPSVPLAREPSLAGTPVVIASYGAQFLATSEVQTTLYPTVVFGSVKKVFTFGTNTIDILELGGSVAAQEGSSGGGVIDAQGELVGTITTSTVEGPTASRNLSAITASYVRAEYASEMGQALDLLLDEPTATSVVDFAPQISVLEPIITANIQ